MSHQTPSTPTRVHAGMRQLQDRCDTRLLADRLDEKLSRTAFTADDTPFIERPPLFFLATACRCRGDPTDVQGRPPVSCG